MRVLVATDAWLPQVNGVVRTYERLALEAPKQGCEVSFLAPNLFYTLPCPTYPEIRLSLVTPGAISRHIDAARPDFIHIATEGPIGLMTRRYFRKMYRRGCPSPKSGATRCSGASTTARPAPSLRPSRSPTTSPPAALSG